MAPNECVILLQQQTVQQQVVKIVTTTSDDASSEDGEHFYDASSELGHSDEAPSSKADSGVGEDSDFDLPEQQLAEQIVQQVEYYFSDAHILKDAFLLKHARRNRDGFISLKLITSFKKVKHVTKDWRVVAYACRALSKRLEVNEAGTKVRRVDPLPETDETSPSRTVVAIGLTTDKASIEAVAEMFSGNGSIQLIRILRPGNTIPPDVRQCANRHPDILTSVCAVVEFELADSARQALNEDFVLPDGIRLVELASRRGNSNRTSPNSSRPVTPQPPSESNTPNNRRRRRGPVQQQNKPAEDSETPRSPFLRRQELAGSSNSSTPNHSPLNRRHMFINRPAQQQQQQQQQPQSPATRPKSSSCSEAMLSNSPPGSHSPWVRRRLGLSDSGRSSPLQQTADNRLSIPTNIVRMPNGPDGTRGFHCAGKPRSASAPDVPLTTAICAV